MHRLDLDRDALAQAGMQPFDIVDILDEVPEIGLGLLMGLVVRQVQFLAFEPRKEALRLGVVVRTAGGRHADGGPGQALGGGASGVLHPVIGVVRRISPRGWTATGDGPLQCRQGRCRVDGGRHSPIGARAQA